MNLIIKTSIDDEIVMSLYKLYLCRQKTKPTKKSFVLYIKDQVEMFGTDEEFLLASMADYEDLSASQVNQLKKWKLIF